jgi:predicted HTH transcriptional regulator
VAQSPFGVPWHELDLPALRTFFERADPATEPLTWEAKGGDWIRAERIRREVVGFANQMGGFLVLGVSKHR